MISSSSALPDRTDDDVVIVATGSVSPTGRNPAEAHQAALGFRTGLRELTQKDIVTFDALCAAKGITTDTEKAEFFRCMWGDKCGVGGVIPPEFFPPNDKGVYPDDFHRKGSLIVGRPAFQAFVAFDQVRKKLSTLFDEDGCVREDLARETMIDIGSGTGSATEMVEQALMEVVDAEVDEKLGMNYGKNKWLLGMLGNMPAAHIASASGIGGAQSSSNAACASSGIGMFNGVNAIRANQADVAIVGGSEFATGSVTAFASFDHMMIRRGALSRDWRKHGPASEALRAFEATRDGFIPGDAAAIVVLMRRRIADLLKLEPRARVLSVAATTCNSHRYGKSLADGTITGQASLLERLFAKGGIAPWRVPGRIAHFLHGTGTRSGAINELYASAKALGEVAKDDRYRATGIKEREGHSLGAAFAANVTAAVEGMGDLSIPGLPTTRTVDPALRTVDPEVIGKEGINIDPTSLEAVADSVLCRRHADFDPDRDVVIVDAKGFGGTNAAALLMKP